MPQQVVKYCEGKKMWLTLSVPSCFMSQAGGPGKAAAPPPPQEEDPVKKEDAFQAFKGKPRTLNG